MKDSFYNRQGKRIFDIVFALLFMIVFCWLYLIVGILVLLNIGRPVIFAQERPGKGDKIFKLFKFRTMTNATDENNCLLPDEKRLTKFGIFLRKTSLDEIPEMLNILKGDMSFVGPRPLLVEYLPYYTATEKRRHAVRPGLTGWSQVNGRNNVGWEKHLAQDLYYVENVSFMLDLKIIRMTIGKVLKGSDIIMGEQRKIGRLDDYRERLKSQQQERSAKTETEGD